MKIDQTYPTPEASQTQRPRSPQTAPAGSSFQDLLAKAVAPGERRAPAWVPGTEPVGSGPGGGSAVWGQINGVLDSLERYGQALGDQAKTLKDIEPLAQELEQRADDLESGLPGSEHPLRELAGEVLAQAQVAAFKFRRGDYL
jgi:hypothetical protein